jgi:hypothetical protein
MTAHERPSKPPPKAAAMRRRLPILLAVVWAALALPLLALLSLAATSALAAEPVFPQDSRIGLVLPPGNLKPSTHFPGFEDSTRKVAISILDLPGRAYETVEQSAFGKTVKGLTVEKRELFSFAGGIGFLITGQAMIDGESVHSWYLLINTMTREAGHVGAFIRVHVPDAARAAYPDAAIRAALRSVTFRLPPAAELAKHLPFKFGDMAGFRVMKVVPPALAVLIDGPTDDPVKHPYMVISIGRGAPREPVGRARFARDLLSSAPVRDLAITSAESMRIGAWPAFEIRANAKGPDGTPLALVQWLRFGGGGFLRVIGVVRRDDWDKLFPRFRAVRDGMDLH